MFDWSAVYARVIGGMSLASAPMGFAVFALCTASGRFLGDFVVAKMGTLKILRLSGLLMSVGIGLCILAQAVALDSDRLHPRRSWHGERGADPVWGCRTAQRTSRRRQPCYRCHDGLFRFSRGSADYRLHRFLARPAQGFRTGDRRRHCDRHYGRGDRPRDWKRGRDHTVESGEGLIRSLLDKFLSSIRVSACLSSTKSGRREKISRSALLRLS
jgi:hypothetical protein